MRILITLLFISTILFSSCRKYRIEQIGCRDDAFQQDGFGLPNILSGNGDGNNDALHFYFDSVVPRNFSIIIKTLAGIKVYESQYPGFTWHPSSGTNRSRVAEDVYRYEICFDVNSKHYHHKGQITNYQMGDRNALGDVCFRNYANCVFGTQWDAGSFHTSLPSYEYFFACD